MATQLESCRHIAEVRDLVHRRWFDQPPARITPTQRAVDLALEFIERLHRIPARRPEARNQGCGRLPWIALHREGERGIRVFGRLGLVDIDVGAHRRPPAIPARLARDSLPSYAKARRWGDLRDGSKDRHGLRQ